MKRRSLIFALGMVVLLVLFWIGGVNAVVYVISLLGVPIVSGALARLHWIRFWLAALDDRNPSRVGSNRLCANRLLSPRWRRHPRSSAFATGSPPALPGKGKRSQVACPVFCSMLGTWVGLDGPN
jgi:hypothetical protein